MRMRKKGKVYPSPTSYSSSMPTNSPNEDASSILKLLPAAVLALASLLVLEDQEVLAYMITRSMKSTSPCSVIEDNKKRSSKKSIAHRPPIFSCECFDCYTSYWFRWDSSPNREVIHQAIEAFEEHLNNGEQSKKNRNRKKEKMSRRVNEKSGAIMDVTTPAVEEIPICNSPSSNGESPPRAMILQGLGEETPTDGRKGARETPDDVIVEGTPVQGAVVGRGTAGTSHKGLARKVLPDVLGLFNSRWWSLWSPNM